MPHACAVDEQARNFGKLAEQSASNLAASRWFAIARNTRDALVLQSLLPSNSCLSLSEIIRLPTLYVGVRFNSCVPSLKPLLSI